ncbi:MAG: metal-dependent hydrolase [Planctomycetota bacterium]
MPSPLAHASLILVAGPVVLRKAPRLLRQPHGPRARRNTWALVALTGVALAIPDADFLLYFAMGSDAGAGHGGPGHSLVAAMLFGPLFALTATRLAGARFWPAAVLGSVAYASHIGLDLLNPGRGVGVLWPWQDRSPTGVVIFEGAAHNDLSNWRRHRRTFLNEISFAAAMFGLGWLVARCLDRLRAAGRAGECRSPASVEAGS